MPEHEGIAKLLSGTRTYIFYILSHELMIYKACAIN
jgi:hypothetical protein